MRGFGGTVPGGLAASQGAGPGALHPWQGFLSVCLQRSLPHQVRQKSNLAFEELTAGQLIPGCKAPRPERTLFVLHGLLGSGRNWRSWARLLLDGAAAAAPAEGGGGPWRALLVDLRCHGHSARRHGLHPPHNMTTAAQDVAQLIHDQLGSHAPGAVLGHSMGGKVALALLDLASTHAHSQHKHHQHHTPGTSSSSSSTTSASPAPFPGGAAHLHTQPHTGSGAPQPLCAAPQQLWVLDSQPGLVAPDMDVGTGVSRVLETVHTVPLPIPSRVWLLQHLRQRGLSDSLAQWLGSNLVPLHQDAHLTHTHTHHQQGGSSSGQQGPVLGHTQAQAHPPLTWAFDIQGAGAMYMSYRTTQYWHLLERPPPPTALFLVQGERSDRWPAEQQHRLLAAVGRSRQGSTRTSPVGGAEGSGPAARAVAGRFEHHVLPRAGHWLHVDNPDGLLRLMLPYIVQL